MAGDGSYRMRRVALRPGDHDLLPPFPLAHGASPAPLREALPDFLRDGERLQLTRYVDRQPPSTSCEGGDPGGHLQSRRRRLLVGAPALAVAVGQRTVR